MKNICLLFCIPFLWIQTALAEEPIKLKVQGYEVPPSAMEVAAKPGTEEVKVLFQTYESSDPFTVTITRSPNLFVQNGNLMGKLTLEESAQVLENMKNCAEYDGGHSAFRVFNVFGETIKQLESCLSQNMDRSIGRICSDEKQLGKLEKTYGNNAVVMAQIEEYRETLDPLKEEAVDQIYMIADTFDEVDVKLGDKIDDEFDSDSLTDTFLGGLANLLVTQEIGGFSRFFEFKMQTLCGYSFTTDSDNGEKQGMMRFDEMDPTLKTKIAEELKAKVAEDYNSDSLDDVLIRTFVNGWFPSEIDRFNERQIMKPRLFNEIDTITLKPEEIEELKDRIAEKFNSDSMNDVLIRSLVNVLIFSERDGFNERQMMKPR